MKNIVKFNNDGTLCLMLTTGKTIQFKTVSECVNYCNECGIEAFIE